MSRLPVPCHLRPQPHFKNRLRHHQRQCAIAAGTATEISIGEACLTLSRKAETAVWTGHVVVLLLAIKRRLSISVCVFEGGLSRRGILMLRLGGMLMMKLSQRRCLSVMQRRCQLLCRASEAVLHLGSCCCIKGIWILRHVQFRGCSKSRSSLCFFVPATRRHPLGSAAVAQRMNLFLTCRAYCQVLGEAARALHATLRQRSECSDIIFNIFQVSHSSQSSPRVANASEPVLP